MTIPKAYLTCAQALLVSITLFLGLHSKIQAQCTVSAPSPSQTPAPSPTPFPLSIRAVNVPHNPSHQAGLGDRIIVQVNCLKEELARQENPQNGVPPQDRIDPKTFVLFINQVEMKKLFPFAVDRDADELHFRLRRDQDSREAWQNFLSRPKAETISVAASVGPEGKPPLKDPKPMLLRIYSGTLFKVGAVLFVLFFVGFLIAAKTTTIIRDSGPPKPVGGPRKRPYSLARAQVAWWFFIILGSFLFIGLVTWDLDTITTSSLVLLGIGAGTALSAALVDANKRESTDNDLETLKPKEAQLVASVAELKASLTDAGKVVLGEDPNLTATLSARRTELATLEAQLEQVRNQINDAASGLQKPVSEGPIMDLLSDVNGLTFHRFQILVWTIVLGLIFIYSVWTNLTMPQFSDTLLALMGISAGTYVGFKIPEQQTDPADAPNMNTVAGVNPADNAASHADTDPQTDEEGC